MKRAWLDIVRGLLGFPLAGQGKQTDDVRQLRRQAEQGDAGARLILGVMYDKGEGVAENHAEAVKWYRLAAEQGIADAQALLGFMYVMGKGVAEDHAEAMKWYRLAAEQGDADARGVLGFMERVKWHRPAAERGDACEQIGPGLMYIERLERDKLARTRFARELAEARRVAKEWRAAQQGE